MPEMLMISPLLEPSRGEASAKEKWEMKRRSSELDPVFFGG